MAKWKKIKTAPRDGTWVLGFAYGAEIPCVVQWQTFESWTDIFKEILDPRWLEDIEGNFADDRDAVEYLSNTQYEPTHWMPLPKLPEE